MSRFSTCSGNILFLLISCWLSLSYAQLQRTHPAYANLNTPYLNSAASFSPTSPELLVASAQWWDIFSPTIIPKDSVHHFYNQANQRTKTIEYFWVKDSSFYQVGYQFLYTYRGDTTISILHQWDMVNQKWEILSRVSEKFDKNGNSLYKLTEYWADSLGDWRNHFQSIHWRDQMGRDTLILHEPWDLQKNSWANGARIRISWGPSSPLYDNKFLSYIWDQYDTTISQWQPYQQWFNTFDVDGTPISFSRYSFSSLPNPPSIVKITWTYNAHKQPIQRLQQIFDYATMNWANNKVWTFSYKSSDLHDLDSVLVKWWQDDTTFTGWVNLSRSFYTQLSMDSLRIDHASWQNGSYWHEGERTVYKDNLALGTVHNVYFENWSGNQLAYSSRVAYRYTPAGHLLSCITHNWDIDSMVWIMKRKNVYYYRPLNVSIDEAISFSFALYPNPTDDFLTIELDLKTPQKVAIQLVDIQGQILKKRPPILFHTGNHRLAIEVADLPEGVYLVLVQKGAESLSKRWIKK